MSQDKINPTVYRFNLKFFCSSKDVLGSFLFGVIGSLNTTRAFKIIVTVSE